MISGAWLMHAVAWFLPATRGRQGLEINTVVSGWEAFLVAAWSIFPHDGRPFDVPFRRLLIALSILSTILFIFASPWIVWRAPRRFQRASAWAAVAAFTINVQWYVISLSENPGLSIGYFLWWWSFALLAIGLFDLSRQRSGGYSLVQDRLGNI